MDNDRMTKLKQILNAEDSDSVFNEIWKNWTYGADDIIVGMILRCHLSIEHFLDLFLMATGSVSSEAKLERMCFRDKLDRTEAFNSAINLLSDGIVSLNRLRNKLAHDLDAIITDESVDPLRKIINLFYSLADMKVPSNNLNIIEEFTQFTCHVIYASTRTYQPKETL